MQVWSTPKGIHTKNTMTNVIENSLHSDMRWQLGRTRPNHCSHLFLHTTRTERPSYVQYGIIWTNFRWVHVRVSRVRRGHTGSTCMPYDKLAGDFLVGDAHARHAISFRVVGCPPRSFLWVVGKPLACLCVVLVRRSLLVSLYGLTSTT